MTVPRSIHARHRKAFGPRRVLTPQTKARYIAESIALHEDAGDTWRLSDYGLHVDSDQWAMVLAALGDLRKAGHTP
jgi:hypothetical protein